MWRNTLSFALVAMAASFSANMNAESPTPIPFAHAHNDYWHDRPLLDALDHGFTSVEADVFLVDGRLLVGHDRNELRPERTLEALYLDPLAKRAAANEGSIFPQPIRFLLSIDIKNDGDACYVALDKTLERYAEMLTTVRNGKVEPGAVTVVLSGNRPKRLLAEDDVRYAGYDGRLEDLQSDAPAHLMPMLSDNWTTHFRWNGDGPMPAAERDRLREIVKQAHDAGRIIRFWATPEKESVWRELRAAGVDLLNTDQLDRMAKFAGGQSRPTDVD